MCGIGGFVGERLVNPPQWQAMLAALAQRGPDARVATVWGPEFSPTRGPATAGLLHARLSIRDPRPDANQPMSNAAGDVWICFNGEVYGYETDAKDLVHKGYTFRTRSDTEFILHGYEEWGDAVLTRLRGMFAFTILDLRRRRLFAARDRLGLKPFLYYWDGRNFAFASLTRALLPYLGAGTGQLVPAAIDAYLAHRYIPAPLSLFAGVARLPAGHALTLDLDRSTLTVREYWVAAPSPAPFAATLDEAVRLRTYSDRPVGLFLSSGIDSAVVAASLVRQGYDNITAYTATFPQSAFDEGDDAERCARLLGLAHKRIPIEPQINADFDQFVADMDEPFADPSALPLWYLARAVSGEIKVVLSGDGGDELFAGYKRYRQHMRSVWRGRLTVNWASRAQPWTRSARRREELGVPWLSAYSFRFSGLSPGVRRYLQPNYLVASTYWRAFPPRARGLAALLETDRTNYLPEYVLRKGDLCTMAHGLEMRAPLLDHYLATAVWALPPRTRFTRPPKRVLVEVCEVCRQLDLLHAKKRGFNPPLRDWLDRELANRFPALGERLAGATNGQLDACRVSDLVGAYRQGESKLAEPVYQLLVLDETLRGFMGS